MHRFIKIFLGLSLMKNGNMIYFNVCFINFTKKKIRKNLVPLVFWSWPSMIAFYWKWKLSAYIPFLQIKFTDFGNIKKKDGQNTFIGTILFLSISLFIFSLFFLFSNNFQFQSLLLPFFVTINVVKINLLILLIIPAHYSKQCFQILTLQIYIINQ